MTISAQDGLISQEKFFSKLVAAKDVSGYYLLHKNDYAYNKSYSKGYPMGAVKRLIHDEKGVVSTLYICFASKYGNESFFDQYFESGRLNPEIEKIAQEGARNHGLLNMSVGDFFDMNLTIPNTPEQQKIASFLTTVDTRIAKQEQKLSLLKAYKKGVMQKLFTQQIRFKDENGEEYPGWEEKSFSSLVDRVTDSYNPITSNKAYDDIELENIEQHTGRLLRVLPSRQQKSIKTKFKQGDILYSKLRPYLRKFFFADFNGVATSEVWVFRAKITPRYVYQLVQSNQFSSTVDIQAGSKMPRADWPTVSKEMFNIPCAQEQSRIANLLDAIDDRIRAEEAALVSAKKWKRALLQKMFI